ncbi:SixA phosphatase family protein [Phytoactinopolyspora limicola]|uniref:SixA phosphatase family protein n=1 Tax=Phytoactinopolyspora limicola TaxID=2715536 RepID=UPI00140A8C30|nr:histidine phosphatase family protein [Phytoactinopolyspora limicola]
MSRTLLLLRHAKSAWPDDVPDHERPLTGRGRRDAEQVGRWLQDSKLAPEFALVSSAQRTRETYERLAAQLDAPPRPQVTDAAYAAGVGDLLDLVRGFSIDVHRAILIGHNPGIGTLATLLDDESSDVSGRSEMRMGYSTAACAVFDVATEWAELNPGDARLTDFVVSRG